MGQDKRTEAIYRTNPAHGLAGLMMRRYLDIHLSNSQPCKVVGEDAARSMGAAKFDLEMEYNG